LENLKERDYLEDLCVDGRAKLKSIFIEIDCRDVKNTE
jgi:hypothetical protein